MKKTIAVGIHDAAVFEINGLFTLAIAGNGNKKAEQPDYILGFHAKFETQKISPQS